MYNSIIINKYFFNILYDNQKTNMFQRFAVTIKRTQELTEACFRFCRFSFSSEEKETIIIVAVFDGKFNTVDAKRWIKISISCKIWRKCNWKVEVIIVNHYAGNIHPLGVSMIAIYFTISGLARVYDKEVLKNIIWNLFIFKMSFSLHMESFLNLFRLLHQLMTMILIDQRTKNSE